ncbi:response regulator [Flavobacterium ginsengiterrae]|uniref:Response regulator n=1 Tax=Flavobacterium ginsengiterrae TaxID=871695 RepID=A0ABP7GS48_9FLAO
MNLETKINPRNIFIADDDIDDRSIFAEALSELEPNVLLTEFEDGLQLMNALHSESSIPDILFLDINMPKYTGLQCLEMMKGTQSKFADIPVIILSTSNDPVTIQTAFDLGASFYAVKPASYNEIKFFLDTVMKMDWISDISDIKSFRLI